MKNICIIGSGASGLAAIKTCLEENLKPCCFERSNELGGLWNYREERINNQGTVMKSTIINTSKEMMCYSDFLIPADYPNFMHNTKVLKYFKLYEQHFKLNDYITYNHEVLKVYQADNFKESGQWIVEVRQVKKQDEFYETNTHQKYTSKNSSPTNSNIENNADRQIQKDKDSSFDAASDINVIRTLVFDAVLICTGHHADPSMAHFEGQENFVGKIIHSHDYTDFQPFANKRTVVVGIGNSGGDIAVELGKTGSEVHLSTRTGSWVVNRIGTAGIPVDCEFLRRFIHDARRRLLPRSLVNWIAEKEINKRFDHSLYGLKPRHHFDAQHVTVNDDLPNCIAAGKVIVRPNIKRIGSTSVEFEDGSVLEDVDAIIMATGYSFSFPMISHEAFNIVDNQCNLYKNVFPPTIFPSTIAAIGYIQPLGAVMPISEMQCRFALGVFKGDIKLCSESVMQDDIKKKKIEMSRFVTSKRHTIQVDYMSYMDELSVLVGCKPNIVKLFLSDPILAMQVYFGPCTPSQYRLQGPAKWTGARQAILTTWDRTVAGFGRKQTKQNLNYSLKNGAMYFITLLIVCFILLYII